MNPPGIVVCARGRAADALADLLRPHGTPVLAPSAADIPAVARAGPPLFVVDFDSLGDERDGVWNRIEADAPRAHVLVIAAPRNTADVAALFTRYRVKNLIAHNDDGDLGDVAVTVRKILRGEIFGVEQYLEPGAGFASVPIRGSADKAACLALVARRATQAGIPRRVAERLEVVADEMVSNAVYDAPMYADGRARYAHLHRRQEVRLGPGEQPVLKLGSDGRRFALAVADPFGSLDARRVSDYLTKCFRRGDDQIDSKAGGAGLGLYYMFESLSHFVINIAIRRRTELIGLVDITPTYRDYARRSKSFNVFVEGELHG